MNPYLDFKTGLQTLRKAVNQQRALQIAVLSIILSLFFTIIAFFLQTVLQVPFNPYWVYPLLVSLSIGLAVVYKVIKRKRFEEELTKLDTHFNLKEQLRTAYEVYRLQKDSFVIEKLIQSAAQSLLSVNYKKIYPLAQPYAYALIVFLVITLYSIRALPKVNVSYGSDGFSIETQDESKQQKPILLKLENLAKRDLSQEKENQKKLKKELDDELTGVPKKTPSLDSSESKAMRHLRVLQDQLNAEEIKSAEEWLAEFDSELEPPPPPENLFDQQFPRSGQGSEQLKDLKDLLENLPRSDAPPSITESETIPIDSQELADLLNQLQKNANDDDSEKSEKKSDDDLVVINDDQNNNNQEESKDQSQQQTVLGGPASNRNDAGETVDEPDDRFSQVGGDKKAEGNKKEPYSLKGTDNRLTQLEGETGEGKRYSVQAQTLTTIGEAKLVKRDFIRSYTQDMESTFQQENIPLKQRQFIKTYFLSLENRK